MEPTAPTAADLMKTTLPVADGSWDVITLAEFLIAHHCKSVPVKDAEGRVIGVAGLDDIADFTLERDPPDLTGWHSFYTDRIDYLEEEMHEGIDVREDDTARVADITRGVLHAVGASTPLPMVCRLMTLKKLSRLLVIDDQGAFAGVVDSQDILSLIAAQWR